MEANEKSAFVIDHDVYFIDIVSDSLLVFDRSFPREEYIERKLEELWGDLYSFSKDESTDLINILRTGFRTLEGGLEQWAQKGA